MSRRAPKRSRATAAEPAVRRKRTRTAKQLDIELIRRHNPELDDEQCPRAHLAAPAALGSLLHPGHWTADAAPLRAFDHIANVLCEGLEGTPGESADTLFHRESTEPVPASALQLYTVECSAEMLSGALYAGFFPFGSEFKYPRRALADRGLLNLEFGGPEGLDPAEYSDLPGGRIILELCAGSADRLTVGKRSLKTVRPADKPNSHGFSYSLTVDTAFEQSWEQTVQEHGIDWVGFSNIRTAFEQLHERHASLSEGLLATAGLPRMVSVELWDDHTHQLVSAEIGCIVGRCYTCLSLFARANEYPRCGQVRAQAAVLWLNKAGVTLFDAGTTAEYYIQQHGFRRVKRAEFKRLWRKNRQAALREPSLLDGQRCTDVRQLLETGAGPSPAGSIKLACSPKGASTPRRSKHAVRVSGVPALVQQSELAAVFARCGQVVKTAVHGEMSGFAVVFGTAAAVKAAKLLNGTMLQFGDVGSAVVHVSSSAPRSQPKKRPASSSAKRRLRARQWTLNKRRKEGTSAVDATRAGKRQRVVGATRTEEFGDRPCIACKQQEEGFVLIQS